MVHAIAEALCAGHTFAGELSFESNLAISAQGCGILLPWSRANVTGRFVTEPPVQLQVSIAHA